MTDAQKKLVEDNHNLIYGYAHNKKIDLNEYYDVLAIGLCNAALKFDDSKGKFATFAYAAMANEYKRYLRYQTAKKVIPPSLVLSLDFTYEGKHGDEVALREVIPDEQSCMEDMIAGENFCNDFLNSLSPRHRKIVSLLLAYNNAAKVARILGCTRQWVHAEMKVIQEKYKEFATNMG